MKIKKNKEKQFKIVVSLAGIMMLISMVMVYFVQLNDGVSAKRYGLFSTLFFVFFGIGVLLCVYIFFIMGDVELTYKNLKSTRVKVNYKKYSEFEKMTRDIIVNNGYTELKSLGTDKTFKMKYAIKKEFQRVDMILLIQVETFEETMLEKYFFIPLNNMIEEQENIRNVTTNLIYIICAEKGSKALEIITEKNVIHGYYKFNLPVAITFDNQTLYIAPQKSDIAMSRYKALLKQFKKMFNELFE